MRAGTGRPCRETQSPLGLLEAFNTEKAPPEETQLPPGFLLLLLAGVAVLCGFPCEEGGTLVVACFMTNKNG